MQIVEQRVARAGRYKSRAPRRSARRAEYARPVTARAAVVATTVFETTSTAALARPSARPFTTDVVTASSGHRPSSCTSAMLSRQKAVANECALIVSVLHRAWLRAAAAAVKSSSRWRSKYSSVFFTPLTTPRDVTVAPVIESNFAVVLVDEPERPSAAASSDLPSNCVIHLDFSDVDRVAQARTSRGGCTARTPVSAPSRETPINRWIVAL